MSSERTIRRKVSQQKKLFYQEYEECLNKFRNINKNVNPEDDSTEIEESESSMNPNKIRKLDNAINVICLKNTLCPDENMRLDRLIAKQFEVSKSEGIEKQEILQKEIFEVNVNKIQENVVNDILCLNEVNENCTAKNFDLRDYLKNFNDESDMKSNSDSDEDFLDLVENDKNLELMTAIRKMCIKYIPIITHQFIDELLIILRKETGAPFPKTARTFLKTPKEIVTRQMGPGEYCHYGLEPILKTFINMYVLKGVNVNFIKLLVGIDGAPLATSSEKGLWIIACSETVLKLVEVLALCHGEDKPPDVNEFLKQFKEEMTLFVNNGIDHQDRHYNVIFEALICDAPAKAFCLCVKYPVGYNSCTKCTICGKYEKAVHFPGGICTLRTDEKMKNQEYNDPFGDDYQKHGQSILKDIPNFGLVTNVPLDYMHLICLGVMLKLIEIWIKSIFSESDIQKISKKLIQLKEFVPSDFCRNPRQFRKIKRLWKATELRQFLLYTGVVVLSNILPKHLYIHFLHLNIAISILVNPILCKSDVYLRYANELLTDFVTDFTKYYGENNVTFNVHNLLHIVEDVKRFGPLDDFSAFRFENLIRKVKSLVRTGNHPMKQIGRRLVEMKCTEVHNEHHDGNFDLSVYRPMQEIYVFKKESISVDCRNNNNCVLLKDGTYVLCHYFMKDENDQLQVIGDKLQVVELHFHEDKFEDISDLLHIKIVKESAHAQCMPYLAESIVAKVCKFPLEDRNRFLVIPLIHTYQKK